MLPSQLEEIKKLPLFERLDSKKHNELIDKIQVKKFVVGEFIFNEGEAGQQLYIIKSGEVEIVRIHDQIAEEVAFLKPGNVFGELGSLGKKTRDASARAFSDAEILIFDKDTAVRLAAQLPSFDLLVGKRYLEREKINANSENKPSENDQIRIDKCS
ncbi:cyclic nucleotide-binding domain-containing protein [Candidatus Gracilibacteria bacterium]|nr:cyclic nucleotide-binding domain-containing protein [Candidatus Gracilibacteria bacterium]